MSKNLSAQTNASGRKRRSFWWLWLILVLVAFAGGIILGLKLNTMPLPNQVKDKLYPVLESYIPGSTAPHIGPAATPEVTPEETPAPEETAAPAALPVPAELPVPEETPAPVETPAPAEPEPMAEPEPVPAALPEAVAAPEETPAARSMTEGELAVSETATFESSAPAKFIGIDAALQIALGHAGVRQSDAEITGVYRTKDEVGTAVYEVGFRLGEQNYSYVIDAVSGEVLGWMLSGLHDSDTATYAASFTGNDQTETQAAADAQDGIGLQRAKEIALAHAGVRESDVLRSSVRLSEGEGTAFYDVEFRITDRRFDYRIDAHTGEILGFELR